MINVRAVWMWVFVFSMAIFSLSVNAQFNQKGLVAAWLFDEGKGKVAKDSSGNELHAEVDKGKAKWGEREI